MSNFLNKFATNPISLDIKRSKFDRNFTRKTTFKSGFLVPIYIDEVLPGDTFKVNIKNVIKMLSPAVPVMDNLVLDTYFYYVPNRLCCAHPNDWAAICGENLNGAWVPAAEKTLSNTGNIIDLYSCVGNTDEDTDTFYVDPDSALHHIGCPVLTVANTLTQNKSVINGMPLMAYLKIWNEYFRDQNIEAPKLVSSSLNELITMYDLNHNLLPVNKVHDYFTSCLPAPQKGNSVLLSLQGSAPVLTSSDNTLNSSNEPLKWRQAVNGNVPTSNTNIVQMAGTTGIGSSYSGSAISLKPSNLYADLSNATATSVNELRQAFALQRLFEKDARGGTRYREMIKNHFNVNVPDLTVQVPEYLGGKRVPINIDTIVQTSATDSNGYLGEFGGFSNTAWGEDNVVSKSFSEYGYIIGVCCVRHLPSYQQGLPKYLMRNRRYDFYYPVFANIGEQPVYKSELYYKGFLSSEFGKGAVFGYQEAWADYRYHPNEVKGWFVYDSGDRLLPKWTFSQNFGSAPALNTSFMHEPYNSVNDTLVSTSTDYPFIAEFYFENVCVRPMPVYSIPGLIDHH